MATQTKQPKISVDMDARIERAFYTTWQAIGDDCSQLDDWRGTGPEIAEMVCDAGRMKQYGGDDEAYAAWDKYCEDHPIKADLWAKAMGRRAR